MSCNWFNSVFLPSIFAKSGTNSAKWITAKQVNVCRDYMHKSCSRTQNADGVFCTHTAYTYNWCGRDVILQCSGLNGCGTIIFGLDEKESASARENAREEQKRIEADRLARLARHPERLEKRIAEARRNLENAIAWLDDDLEDKASKQEIEADKAKIEEYEKELETLLNLKNGGVQQ